MHALMIATLIPDRPDINQILVFSLTGFCLVMVVLAGLSLATSWIGKLFSAFAGGEGKPTRSKSSAAASPAAVSPASARSPAPAIDEGHAFAISAAVAAVLPDLAPEEGELIAVIAAAASEALDADVRVVSFKPVDMSYAMQGRFALFASKNYVPKRM